MLTLTEILVKMSNSYNNNANAIDNHYDEQWANAFYSNTTISYEERPIQKDLYQDKRRFLFSGILLVLGVIGNSLALLILARKKATKNSKYTLMLR